MKKLLFIVCSLTMTTLMTACGDDDKDDNKNGDVTIGQLNKTTWASLAKINTFMNDFPAYDGEIDNYTITNASGVDMLVFFDYACEQSEYDEYAAKLEAAGFEKTPASSLSAIYKKTSTKRLSISMSYSAGNLAISVSSEAL